MKPIMISLLLAISLVPSLCIADQTEPNNAGAELTFQDRSSTIAWKIESEEMMPSARRYFINPGPTQPTHVAELVLHEDYTNDIRASTVLSRVRNSGLFKNMSEAQQAFLDTELAVWVEDENPCKPNYFSTWLYGVSEADAKLMARAYLDGLTEECRRDARQYKARLSDDQKKLAESQEELLKKTAELKACQEQYEPVKQGRHEFRDEAQATESARQTIGEMDKMLDALDIELAGLRQKVQTIEKYRQSKESPREAVLAKLDEMFVELMVELTGLEARRDKSALIRATEQRFLRLQTELDGLRADVYRLEEDIQGCQGRIESYTHRIATPPRSEQGPKVFQNTVFLYRVHNPNEATQP